MPIREARTRAMPYGASKHSSFLVTINTQRAVKPNDAESDILTDIFRRVLFRLFDDRLIPRMVKFLGQPRDVSKLKGVETEVAIERGGVQRRLHAHLLVDIFHNSKIQLDPIYIRDEVTDEMNDELRKAGLPELKGKVYVNIKAVRSGFNALRYIRKGATPVY